MKTNGRGCISYRIHGRFVHDGLLPKANLCCYMRRLPSVMSVPTAIMRVARPAKTQSKELLGVLLALIWQGQEEGEALDNAPDVLADKLRDYLMGKGEALAFYEVAVRQVAN